jgi:aminobenzoyl-glutamate utilization protein B
MLQLRSQESTEEEISFAQELVNTLNSNSEVSLEGFKEEVLPTACQNNKLLKGTTFGASTDVGDVCWITPVGQFMTTCAPAGVQFHTWQATASFGSSIGFKGMHFAAKTMALTLYDLLLNKDKVLEKAKKEFKSSTNGKTYVPGIPDSMVPVINP